MKKAKTKRGSFTRKILQNRSLRLEYRHNLPIKAN